MTPALLEDLGSPSTKLPRATIAGRAGTVDNASTVVDRPATGWQPTEVVTGDTTRSSDDGRDTADTSTTRSDTTGDTLSPPTGNLADAREEQQGRVDGNESVVDPSQRFLMANAVAALRRTLFDDEADETAFMDAASRLRRAAVASRHRAPRHAALALLLSDALTFTSPNANPQPARASLVAGVQGLQESFIATGTERVVIQGLLAGGWNLTAPFDAAVFSSVAPELFATGGSVDAPE